VAPTVRVLTALDADEIARLRERGEFFWLDLHGPSEEDLAKLDELFGLNPLARRQLRAQGQRAKLYLYGDHAVMVFWGMSTGTGQAAFAEVHLLISGDGVVTVRERACPALHSLRDDFESGQAGAEQFVLYRILDAMTDAFFPVLEGTDEEIDSLEDAVLERPTDDQLQRLSDLKRELVGLRRIIGPERDLFLRASEDLEQIPGLEPGTRDYFRDLEDHLIRLSDTIDAYRDLLTGALDVYLSTVSNRMNVVMERLTIVATIFLPLTLLTGFFGMNFGWLLDHIETAWTFWVFGVGGSVLSSLTILWWIRRNRLT
jgi:magnesium transporter